ncbi:MAG: haloacid dehalogenase, partial [Actinophytocola sp.]|nr:haloacid dehalogenase [Actinophytocola sp.]
MTQVQLVVTDLAGTTVEDPGLVLGAFRAGLAAVDAEDVTDAQLTALMGVDKREAFATLLDLEPDDSTLDRALAVFVARTLSDAAAGR